MIRALSYIGLAVIAAGMLAAVRLQVIAEPSRPAGKETIPMSDVDAKKPSPGSKLATFGAGCFWCVEAVFQEVEGVESVVSGYSGGALENPSYRDVCTGGTGHAEVCQLRYDPSRVTFPELLEVFWQTHDPTTKDRQGADTGTQYRSVIFYHDEEQRELAERYKKELDESGAFAAPIVTEIDAFEKFYPAEDDHQDYFSQNANQPYCQFVIQPKLEKFRKVFKAKLKGGS